ncbi:MAPEG family protein [Aliiroseovarius sp. YM-037]|uniref:MAPEG family protein n=1 Tax=Aliiroseovarius sp. YM-037 TaxID=3341728 RepID=UPI003A803A31
MSFPITAIYAAVLALMSLALTYHVIFARARTDVSIGDGGDTDLALRIRKHGNFHENIPLSLILMGLAEANGLGAMWLHGVGLLLVVGRALHATGLAHEKAATFGRIAGLSGNHIANLICVVAILWRAFQ